MGLDLYLRDGEHVARWSYGGFNRFRTRLALAVGIELQKMDGFDGQVTDTGSKTFGSWEDIDDALVPFLHHSDCDGTLSPTECAKIAPRLLEIVTAWPGSAEYPSDDYDYDKAMALQLVDGMNRAVELNTDLVFG